MKYQETGFRALYNNFAAFPLNEKFRKARALRLVGMRIF